MYVDKLDGRVDGSFSNGCQVNGAQSRIVACARSNGTRRQTSPISKKGCGFSNLRETRSGYSKKQEPREKRRLLNFLVSNCSWRREELIPTLRQPFDLLAETSATAAQEKRDGQGDLTKIEIWVPFLDAYRTMCRVGTRFSAGLGESRNFGSLPRCLVPESVTLI
jgi:site-specific DNA recombinase